MFKRLAILFFAAMLPVLAYSAANSAEPAKIVAFGDSLMAGYGLSPGESFPEKLEQSLQQKGHDVVISGAGVSGDTSTGGLQRLDWSVPDDTDLVILELGANDMLRGIAPSITRSNLDEMITKLRDREIDVLLVGMLAAPNLGPDYAEAFNPIYPELANEYGLPFYPFFLDGVAAQPQLLLGDGMHPNADGVDRIVEGILPLVEAQLKK
ncbi:arylesterase [Mesorhizobium sp. Z1-4]|uniref:arylesterase n=1 Tax=Mesorhizobium sp. Z1-4 TaxID=2448478 RepID=UPI000FD80D6D|nr:arylesterase [Mesorhizobium sp. Z1-4]